MASFGVLLRRFRERSLLTQEDLATRTGLSSRTIRRLECDRRPRIGTIRLLAGQLDLSDAERSQLVRAGTQEKDWPHRAGSTGPDYAR